MMCHCSWQQATSFQRLQCAGLVCHQNILLELRIKPESSPQSSSRSSGSSSCYVWSELLLLLQRRRTLFEMCAASYQKSFLFTFSKRKMWIPPSDKHTKPIRSQFNRNRPNYDQRPMWNCTSWGTNLCWQQAQTGAHSSPIAELRSSICWLWLATSVGSRSLKVKTESSSCQIH